MAEYFWFVGSTSLAVIAYGVYHVCVQLIHIRFDLKRVTLALETRNQLAANRIAAEIPVAQVDADEEAPVVGEVAEDAPPPPPPPEVVSAEPRRFTGRDRRAVTNCMDSLRRLLRA